MSKFYHTRSPNIRKMHFWDNFGCCMGIICLHTPTKSSLAVILRGQLSFYGHRLKRWWFCDSFALPGLFPGYFRQINHDPKYGTCFYWLSLTQRSRFWRENESISKFTREVTQLLEYLQSVIELIICSCKKNCDSLCYNSKKKGLVCSAMCQCLNSCSAMCHCLNSSNIEFDKPEFEW